MSEDVYPGIQPPEPWPEPPPRPAMTFRQWWWQLDEETRRLYAPFGMLVTFLAFVGACALLGWAPCP